MAWAVLASTASAVVVHTPAGRFFGVMPRAGVALSRTAGGSLHASPNVATVTSTGALEYHGGPVLHTTRPYLIFWDPAGTAIDATARALFSRYMADTAADSALNDDVFDVTRQYTDATGYAASGETFTAAQAVSDRQPYPTSGDCTRRPTPVTTCLTDAQIVAELQRITAADDLPSGVGADTPVYFVVLPATVNVCVTDTECADNYFCAYHGDFPDSAPSLMYAAIPLLNATKACQLDSHPSTLQEPNGTAADVAVDNLSHEYNESISDPEGNAWYDDGSDNEEADFCQEYAVTRDPVAGADPNAYGFPGANSAELLGVLFDQRINGDPYYTQSEWSNGARDCGLGSNPSVLPGFSTTPFPEVGAVVTFHPMPDSGTDSSNTWSFGDGSGTFATGAPAAQSHVYAAPGTYTVSRTEVDSLGSLGTQSQTIAVDVRPKAAFTASTQVAAAMLTNVAFDASGSADANPGVRITSYDWSFGDGTGTLGGAVVTHHYLRPGTYTVALEVFGSDGLSAATTRQIRVESAGSLTWAADYPVSGTPIRFDGAPKPLGIVGAAVAYRWTFGDGGSAAGARPRHTYDHSGNYRVTVTLTTADGLKSRLSRLLHVHPAEMISKLTLKPAPRYRARLTAIVNGPGTLVIAGRRYKLSKRGSASCLLTLTKTEMSALRAGRPVRLRVRVVFHPRTGRRSERTASLTMTG
jgi:PKD repeat protein